MAKGINKAKPKVEKDKSKKIIVSKQRVAVEYDNVKAEGWMPKENGAESLKT